jgi:hypothetical protein
MFKQASSIEMVVALNCLMWVVLPTSKSGSSQDHVRRSIVVEEGVAAQGTIHRHMVHRHMGGIHRCES